MVLRTLLMLALGDSRDTAESEGAWGWSCCRSGPSSSRVAGTEQHRKRLWQHTATQHLDLLLCTGSDDSEGACGWSGCGSDARGSGTSSSKLLTLSSTGRACGISN